MSRRKFLNGLKHGPGGKWTPERKDFVQDNGVQFGTNTSGSQDGLDFRSEYNGAIVASIEEGPNTKPITGEKKALVTRIPDRESELAIEALQAFGTKLLVHVQKHLCIGSGCETMPTRLQFRSQLDVIENLTIEYDPESTIFV